jgi:hypothetical protein
MPELIWKVDNNQFDLFEFFDDNFWYGDANFISFVFKNVELMNIEARIIFANHTFIDNFWEILEDDKIEYIYIKIIVKNINKLSFAECYNILSIFTNCWRDEDDELFTTQKLKNINELIIIKTKVYNLMCNCISLRGHIEHISDDLFNELNLIKSADNTETANSTIDNSIQSSRICYKILLKNNSNNIAQCIYEKIGNTKNVDKDLLVNITNDYILNHLKSPLYEKDYLEKVIYEYGIQRAIEEFIVNSKIYDNIIALIDDDLSKIYLGIVYYIISESFEYMSFIISSL